MTQPEEQQVYDTILANLHAALKRWYKGDTLGYTELFADEFTLFNPLTSLRLETINQLRDHYPPMMGTIDLPRYELIEPKFQLQNDIGILTYFLKQYSSDGPVGPTYKSTEVYQRADGRWPIIHAHWSTILESE